MPIRCLLRKIEPIGKINFNKSQKMNIEEEALSYLFVVFLFLFEFDPLESNSSSSGRKHKDDDTDRESEQFNLDEWYAKMKPLLANVDKLIIGW